jgi:magnesium-transporting ATPase (P-type)
MIFAIAIFLQILAMLFLAVLIHMMTDKFKELDIDKVTEKEAKSLVIQLVVWAALWGTTWVASITLFWMS